MPAYQDAKPGQPASLSCRFPRILHDMLLQIFFFCCKSAPDVALGFVHVEHLARFFCQRMIEGRQTLCDVFMYRTLAHSERLGRLAHGGVLLDNVVCDANCPLLDILFQSLPLKSLFLQCMRGRGENMTRRGICCVLNLSFYLPHQLMYRRTRTHL